MFRFPIIVRGLLLAGALALVSIPASAQAGGGVGFCGNYGGGCFPKTYCCTPCYNYCYQPCYRPLVVYQPVVTTCYVVQPTVCQPVIQPWMFNASRPLVQKTQPILIQSR